MAVVRVGITVGIAYDELRETFDCLADGADPSLTDDLRDMPFGIYGHLADKFAVHWFFQGEKPRQRRRDR